MGGGAGRALVVVASLGLLVGACSGAGDPAAGDTAAGETAPAAGPEPGSGLAGEGCAQPYTLVGRVRSAVVSPRERPSERGAVVARFPRINAQGAHQVFPLIDEVEREGRTWYEVSLPMRPNGSTGWIRAGELEVGRSDFRLEVDLSRLRLRLFERCERVASYPIGIGTLDTPTPRGTFFLNSLLRPPERGSVYGAFAFGLSAYSEVIRNWEGGGIVGLHGTNDPSSIGRRMSHGCIRLANAAIRHLATTVPLGTVVEIR